MERLVLVRSNKLMQLKQYNSRLWVQFSAGSNTDIVSNYDSDKISRNLDLDLMFYLFNCKVENVKPLAIFHRVPAS